MRKRHSYFGGIALLASFGMSLSAFAQQEQDPPPESRQGEEAESQQVEPEKPATQSKPGQTAQRHQVAQLQKLHKAMRTKLKLTKAQKRIIDGHFDVYLSQVQKRRSGRRVSVGGNRDPDGLRALRKEMLAASKSRDREKVRRLREQFREKMTANRAAGARTVPQFLKALETELDKDQRIKFYELTRRLRIGSASEETGEDLRALWRAVMRPELELSPMQRSTISRKMQDGFRAVEEAQRNGSLDEVDELAAEVRADIVSGLFPEQRSKLNEILAEDQPRRSRFRGGGKRDRP